MLCVACVQVIQAWYHHTTNNQTTEEGTPGHLILPHHSSAVALAEAVSSGCTVCFVLDEKLRERLDLHLQNTKCRFKVPGWGLFFTGQKRVPHNPLNPLFAFVNFYANNVVPAELLLKYHIQETTSRSPPRRSWVLSLALPLTCTTLDCRFGKFDTVATRADRLRLARFWLKECFEWHPAASCSRPSAWRPPRLLDLGPEAAVKPRLVETDHTSVVDGYLTPSHRWGGENILKLTVQNKESWADAIPTDALPPTFLDAMHVTKDLGYRFLWYVFQSE